MYFWGFLFIFQLSSFSVWHVLVPSSLSIVLLFIFIHPFLLFFSIYSLSMSVCFSVLLLHSFPFPLPSSVSFFSLIPFLLHLNPLFIPLTQPSSSPHHLHPLFSFPQGVNEASGLLLFPLQHCVASVALTMS